MRRSLYELSSRRARQRNDSRASAALFNTLAEETRARRLIKYKKLSLNVKRPYQRSVVLIFDERPARRKSLSSPRLAADLF